MRAFSKCVTSSITIALVLTGCGSSQSNSTPTNNGSTASNKTVINFAAIKTQGGYDSWTPLIKKFESENPDIQVHLTQLPSASESTQIHQYLVTALNSGQSDIDVFTGDIIWVPEFAAAGWTEPVDQIVDKSQYYPGVINALTYKGQLVAFPWYVDGGMLYYRKDLLDKYHLPVPKTWDELTNDVKTIKNGEHNPNLQGFLWQGKQAEVLTCDFNEFLASAGGSIIDKDGNATINSSQALNALNFMKSTIDDKVSPSSVTTFDEEPSRSVFTDGNAIFLRNWSYVWPIAQDSSQSKVAGKVGVAPLPAFFGGKSASTLGGYQYMVAKNSKHLDAANKFAEFLSSQETQLYFAKNQALSPTRPAVLDDPSLKSSNPFLLNLKDVFQGGTPRPVSPNYPKISLALQADISAVLSKQMQPKDALTDISNKINALK